MVCRWRPTTRPARSRSQRTGASAASGLAGLMAVPIVTLDKITKGRTATGPGGAPVTLKRSFSRFKGKELSERQVQANDRVSG